MAHIWTETSNEKHGGLGWELGTCLWSPTKDVNGRPRAAWEALKEISPGDHVYHLTRKSKSEPLLVWGFSIAKSTATVTTSRPIEPEEWSHCSEFYRLELEAFLEFPSKLRVQSLLNENFMIFCDELEESTFSQFFSRYGKSLRATQKYIAKCSLTTSSLLKNSQPVNKEFDLSQGSRSHSANIYAIENKQARFSKRMIEQRLRDTSLIKKLKKSGEYKCAICGYSCQYEPGKYLLEGAHLQPLKDGGPDLASNILVLCALHHKELDWGVVSIDPFTGFFIRYDTEKDTQSEMNKAPTAIEKSYIQYHFNKIYFKNRFR